MGFLGQLTGLGLDEPDDEMCGLEYTPGHLANDLEDPVLEY